jgi:hypothetical protein
MDKIEKVYSLSTASYGGLALQSNDGKSIYYFGGNPNGKLVHKFNTETNVTVRLPIPLPYSVVNGGGALLDGRIFIFSGMRSNCMQFSLELERAWIVGGIPYRSGVDDPDDPLYSITALPADESSVWLFQGTDPPPSHPIMFFSTRHLLQIPSEYPYTLPTLYERPVSVGDGHQGYLIGGFGWRPEQDGSYYSSDGVLK